MTDRSRALDELASEQFDVLVVGAGIVGSRIAYEGARAGLRVALVDAGDFGGGTSSVTSKFVHGGLRYMTSWQLRLVRSAQREREALFRIAPHLVRRRPMVLAERAGYPLPVYAAGLALYKGVSGTATPWPRIVSVRRGRELAPFLRPNGVRTCTLLPEAQTDDFRLTLATVRAAVEHGACAASYVGAVGLERLRGRVAGAVLDPGFGDQLISVSARAVVNAAGPWVDAVRTLEDPGCAPLVRLSKGAHVVLRRLGDDNGTGVVSSRDGSRTTFAVPFHGMLLLGVTDTPHDEPPRCVTPAREDVEGLFEDASHFVAAELLDRDRITHAFAGLRALPCGDGETSRLSREHVVSTGPGGMISVAGGKLTTHRVIAVDVLRRLPPELGLGSIRPSDDPLPGGEPPPRPGLIGELDVDVTRHLLRLYGGDAATVVAYGESDPSLLERIDPGGPDVWAQVRFAIDHEWARTADDVLRRRTTLALRGLDGPAVRARVASLLHAAAPEPVA